VDRSRAAGATCGWPAGIEALHFTVILHFIKDMIRISNTPLGQ
jgi:hypothetical protein